MISVIIPAHNEEQVIRRVLQALTQGSRADELEIIVVCNGCIDSTADIARSCDGPVRVIEIETASKSRALNTGDRIARGYPRFYLDADLIFSIEDLRVIAASLLQDGLLAAAPEMEFDLSGASRAVNAYYRVWQKMPYFDTGRIAGAYGLSERGRARFSEFPDVIADDGFVRLQFAPAERATIRESRVIVIPPKSMASLLRVKTRSHRGVFELRRKYPLLLRNETASPGKSLQRLLQLNLPWSEIGTYVFVSAAAKMLGKLHQIVGVRKWARDDSSR
jgi:glycosyltransferase involved in cell wall biosynthesis